MVGLILNIDFLGLDVFQFFLSGYVLSILLSLSPEHFHLVSKLSYLHPPLEVRIGVFEVGLAS